MFTGGIGSTASNNTGPSKPHLNPIITGGIRSTASNNIGPSKPHLNPIITGGIGSIASINTDPSNYTIWSNVTGGIGSTTSNNTGPSNGLLIHQSHWRYREHNIHQYRPQCLITIHKNSLAVSEAQYPSIPAPAFPSKKIYLTQSLPVCIGPDKAYQVARSTKFHFKINTWTNIHNLWKQ